mmetsp:Transcript_36419/g.100299  ORF Transcript_36419/g.100299 Transcript_36419/m.100299 type:complete len:142 (+) Transcript_36419:53-478(+)|eukprot:CAMPEP_0117605722 /NCGR_PEP_ID=MMETSP0784-20121206/79340_1 /TAXON_ID=39447 /ORGANISM="" /LENGTH=141 /DNA_ID=CAMNT_0005408775 /DNA_START=51 /DNA_END=476 /DNA_ORIENTATION=+
MSSVDAFAKKKEWSACLAKSGGNPGRCEKLEKELRTVAKTSGVDCCIAETIALMRCTAGSSKAAGCSEEFLAMRECNRAGGKQLVAEGAGYAIAPAKMGLFESTSANLVSSTVPVRSLEGMQHFAKDYAASLGMSPGEVRF